MTYEEILAIVQDHTRTPFQKAADIHATLQSSRIDSQKPVQARKVRKATHGRVSTKNARQRVSKWIYDPF